MAMSEDNKCGMPVPSEASIMRILEKRSFVSLVICSALNSFSAAIADETASVCDKTILGYPACAVGDFGARPLTTLSKQSSSGFTNAYAAFSPARFE